MKKIVAYIFLFIFSFQILPVKELGKMLFKQQMTEEIKEDCSQGGTEEESKAKNGPDPLHNNSGQSLARIQYLSHQLSTAIHHSERLPIHHVADVFTPPPNC